MKRGFGIAETLIASTIIASLVLSFLGITNVINHSAQLGYQQSVAANLAQRRIEEMRYAVEQSWNNSRRSSDELPDAEWAPPVDSDLVSPQDFNLGGIDYSTRVTVDWPPSEVLPPLHVKNESGIYVTPQNSSDINSLYRRVHVDVLWSEGSIARSYSLETVITNWREGVL